MPSIINQCNLPGQLLALVEVLKQCLDCAYCLISRRWIVSDIFGGRMCLHQRGTIGQRVHAQIYEQCQHLKGKSSIRLTLYISLSLYIEDSTYQNTQLKDTVVRNVIGREQQQMEACLNDVTALAKQLGTQRWLRLVERVRQIDEHLHDRY